MPRPATLSSGVVRGGETDPNTSPEAFRAVSGLLRPFSGPFFSRLSPPAVLPDSARSRSFPAAPQRKNGRDISNDTYKYIRAVLAFFKAARHVPIDPSEIWKLREIAARARGGLEALF